MKRIEKTRKLQFLMTPESEADMSACRSALAAKGDRELTESAILREALSRFASDLRRGIRK